MKYSLPSAPVNADFPTSLEIEVGQLVVERDQPADQRLGLGAAIGPDHVRTGFRSEGRAQQRVVLAVRLRQEGESCSRMRGLECGLRVIVVCGMGCVVDVDVPDGDLLRQRRRGHQHGRESGHQF